MAEAPDSGAQHRYFFDISGLIDYIENADSYSGIQRVVSTLITEFSGQVPLDRVYLTWCDRASKTLLCAPFSAVGKDVFLHPHHMRMAFFPNTRFKPRLSALQRYTRKPVKYYYHRTRLDIAALLNRDRAFERYMTTASKWRQDRRPRRGVNIEPVTGRAFADCAASGDHIIILDLASHESHLDAYKAAKQQDVEVHTLVHDLIPLVTPHLCPELAGLKFYNWLTRMMQITDHFMANSMATHQDLRVFLDGHGNNSDIHTLPLAQAGLPVSQEALHQHNRVPDERLTELYPQVMQSALVEEQVRVVLSGAYVLCVGTVELRKNVWRILMAWKALLDKGQTNLPKLVFAGRPGVMRMDFERTLSQLGHLYGYVEFIDSPSDTELDVLYRNCTFTIMASHYEGWGLPVGESLAYGKTAVVADNSSLPEVGGNLVEYCRADDIESIANAVDRLLDPAYRSDMEARVKATTLRGWDDVARDLKTALTKPVPGPS